jgi:hypothetical protein
MCLLTIVWIRCIICIKNNEKAQKQTHFMMEQLDLVDSFREFNPVIKRYTWRGPAKNKLG